MLWVGAEGLTQAETGCFNFFSVGVQGKLIRKIESVRNNYYTNCIDLSEECRKTEVLRAKIREEQVELRVKV